MKKIWIIFLIILIVFVAGIVYNIFWNIKPIMEKKITKENITYTNCIKIDDKYFRCIKNSCNSIRCIKIQVTITKEEKEGNIQ